MENTSLDIQLHSAHMCTLPARRSSPSSYLDSVSTRSMDSRPIHDAQQLAAMPSPSTLLWSAHEAEAFSYHSILGFIHYLLILPAPRLAHRSSRLPLPPACIRTYSSPTPSRWRTSFRLACPAAVSASAVHTYQFSTLSASFPCCCTLDTT
jgi:hypothetical protein